MSSRSDRQIQKQFYSDEQPLLFKEPTQCGSIVIRIFVLVFICLTSFGVYFAGDTFQAMGPTVKQQLDISNDQFTQVVTLSIVPLVLFSFFGGILLDRFGVYLLMIVASFVVLTAMTLLAVGAYLRYYWLILVARLLYGSGFAPLISGLMSYMMAWFRGAGASVAVGCWLTSARLGTFATFDVDPVIAQDYSSVVASFWFAAIMAGVSTASVISLVLVGRYGERRFGAVTVTVTALRLSLLKAVLPHVILPALVAACIYSADMTFFGYATQIYNERWGLDPVAAGRVSSAGLAVTMVCSPLVGVVLMRFPYRGYFIATGLAVMSGALAVHAATLWNPYYSVPVLGLGMALSSAAFWPCVDLSVAPEHIGTAIGLTLGTEAAIVMGVMNFLTFLHQRYDNDYVPALWMLSGVAGFGVLLAVVWIVYDARGPKRINSHRRPIVLSETLDITYEE